ncbi:MAG: Ig-like domain repeat protein [Bdellovibrionales bacterium]|nr:Ig-like domain repeat protein [Bdellovibrionales bacterium]
MNFRNFRKSFVFEFRYQSFVTISLLILLGFFQNCGEVNFQTTDPLLKSDGTKESQTIPTGRLLINNGDEFTNRKQVQLLINSENALEMAISNQSCLEVKSADWLKLASQKDWIIPDAQGLSTVYLLLRGPNKEISSCIEASIVLDQIAPTATIMGPQEFSKSPVAQFKIDPQDEGSGVKEISCQAPGVSVFKACDLNTEFKDLSEGSQVLTLYITDKAGNRSQYLSHSWFVDLSAPQVQITSPTLMGPLTVKTTTIYFEGSDSNGSGIENYFCYLNNQLLPSCSSPQMLSDLTDGSYRFQVKAIDKAGWESETAEYDFVVDTQTSGDFQILGITGGNDTKVDNYLSDRALPQVNWIKSAGAQKYVISLFKAEKLDEAMCGPIEVTNVNSSSLVFPDCLLLEGEAYVARALAYRNGLVKKADDFLFRVDTAGPTIEIVNWTLSEAMKKVKFEFKVTDEVSGLQSVTCYRKYKDMVSQDNCLNKNTIEYQDLAPGDYQFYMSATDRLEHLTQTQPLDFRINCPLPGQRLVEGVCRNTIFTECMEFVELDTSSSPIVVPSLADTGKCFYKKIINATNTHSSGSAGELRAMDVLSRNHDSGSATPSHPYILGESYLSYIFQGPRTISLSSSASADGTMPPLKIDNYFLVETMPENGPKKMLARGTADALPWKDSSKNQTGPILVDSEPVTDFQSYASGGTATVPYMDVSGNFTVGVPTSLRVRQLDCGGSASASDVFIIIR